MNFQRESSFIPGLIDRPVKFDHAKGTRYAD